jgi:two-component system chemotaxis sensor kinase CheA
MAVRPDLFDTMLRAMDVVRQLSMEPEQVAAQQIAEVMTALAQADSPIQQAQPTPSTPAPEIDEPSEPIVEPKVTAHPAQEECAPESQPLHEQLSTQEQPQAPLSTEASSEQVSANVTEFAAGTKAKRTQGASSTSRRTATRSPRTAKKKAATEPATERVIVQPVDTSTTQIAAVQEQSSASLLVDTPPQPERTPAQPERSDAQALTVHKLEARAQAKEAGAQGRKKKGGSAPTETVRIETAKLDALFLQAEEMLTVKLKTGAYAAELRGMTTMLSAWKREWLKVHLHVRKAQSLLERLENRDSTDPVYIQTAKLVHFLNWTHEHFRAVDKTLAKMTKTIAKDQQSLGSMVDILLDDAKKILLLPFSSALEALPRMVRDLSRAQGKEIDFSMHGEAVEIDKRILEAIKDPLVHLLRNCVDHGIERPAEREQWNKSPRGTLTIAVSPSDGNTVEIVVTDDGGGINVDKVKTAAVSCGVLSQEEAAQLPDHEAIGLIFQSAVSTSDVVSDISGRGLGMTIVREKIEKLGGSITVATQLHHGTTFRIRLPLTLATFRGILIQVAGQSFIAPTANVERVVRFKQSSTVQSADGKETLSLAGYTLPFVRLHRALGLASPASTANNERFQLALVVGQDDQQIAFGIDAAVDEQEVLFKNLGPQLVRVRNIAGATVLGSGQIVAILNMSDLLTAVNNSTLAPTQSRQEAPKVEVQKKKILVAEDSITSRMLLKEILESAGYTVSTAIDGEDAFSTLQDGAFDLVVSDVEMPRVDGFSLTGKIRGDGRYTQLPVVLVTGLESQGDRERGVAVGASAYVVKGSFDQSNLLETIRRLI